MPSALKFTECTECTVLRLMQKGFPWKVWCALDGAVGHKNPSRRISVMPTSNMFL